MPRAETHGTGARTPSATLRFLASLLLVPLAVAAPRIASADDAAKDVSAPAYVEINARGYRVFKHPADGARMIEIPAGAFEMGESAEFEARRKTDWQSSEAIMILPAHPVHDVALDAFLIEETPVTVRQYGLFLAALPAEGQPACCHADEPFGKSHLPSLWDQQVATGADDPVFGVDWFDAYAFARWAGRDLPTEAQWEKAASWDEKGGKKRRYPWGDEWAAHRANSAEEIVAPDDPHGNWWDQWSEPNICRLWAKLFPYVTRVGAFPEGASAYGVLEMAGNVGQWASDWYDPTYFASSPRENPPGPTTGDSKVIRGSAWFHGRDFCLTTHRTCHMPWSRCGSVGIRTVCPSRPSK